MILKRILILFLGLNWSYACSGQVIAKLSLAEAYELLEARYPSLKDAGLVDQLFQKEIELLDINQLPSLELKGDGRLQSQSTQLEGGGENAPPIEINQPLVSIKSYVEANYLLLDGGLNEVQRKLKAIDKGVENQSIEVEKFALRKRVNQLFLNIQLLNAQAGVFEISLKDLAARKQSIQAGVEYGTVLESELTKLRVKELELQAQIDQVDYQLQANWESLKDLLSIEINESTSLEFPILADPRALPSIQRPEQELFQLQKEAVLAQSELIDVDRKPKLNLFAQAGVGYPNPLNILDNGVAPYGVIGAGFNWKITDWKKSKIDKEILSLHAQKIQHAEETFAFNLDQQKAAYLSDVGRLQKQIENDREIAQLQRQLLDQLAIQLDEGIITSTDYVLQLNSELLARQNVSIHQVELQKRQLEFWNEWGGF